LPLDPAGSQAAPSRFKTSALILQAPRSVADGSARILEGRHFTVKIGIDIFDFHGEKDLEWERLKPNLSYILGQKVVDSSLN
jgi:hypothetical protein